MTRERLVTEYTADTRNFRRGARVYDRTLALQERLTNDRLTRVDRRLERSTRNILATRTALSGLTGLVGGAAFIQLRKYAEEWRDVERRLQSIGATSAEAQRGLVELALRTRGSIGGTAAAVQRLSKSTGDDIETTSRRVETLQKLLATAGASGTERNSVALQLGQALQSGVLSGDEFRSIRENAPVELLDALAAAADVTRAELRGFAEDQKLTTDIVLQALDSLASTADARFGALAISGEEAFEVLTTGLTVYAGNVDKALGATETINGALAWLGENLSAAGDGADTMARAIKIAGTVALATAGSRGVGALVSAFRRSADTARFAYEQARRSHAASRQAVIDAQGDLAARRAVRRERELDHQQQVFNDRSTVRSARRRRAAIVAERQALDRLRVAQSRATVVTDRLAAAQNRLAFAVRARAVAVRGAQAAMAFFGGPVGLAITAATLFAGVLATARTNAERLQNSLDSLSGAFGKIENVNSALASDYETLTTAQDRLAEATRKGGQAAVDAATQEVAALNTRIRANEKLRRELALVVQAKLNAAREQLEERRAQLERDARIFLRDLIREQGRGGPDVGLPERTPSRPNTFAWREYIRIQRVTTEELRAYIDAERERVRQLIETGATLEELNAFQRDLVSGTTEAEVKVEEFAAQLEVLNAAAVLAGEGIDETGKSARQLAEDAAAAQAGIAGLVAAIPELHRAARVKAGLAKAQADRDAALKGIDGQGLSGLARLKAEGQVIALYKRAVSEIVGTEKAIRDADKALKSFTDRAHLNSLSAQEQAVVRQTREYEALRKQMEGAGASQERLAEAEAAHRQSLANIEERFAARGSRGRSGGGGAGSGTTAARNLAAARGLLVENGQKAIYIEQELNAEHERLRDLLPALIDMGLSRADAEAVLNSELERTEERLKRIRSASEEAAYAFARGVLQDIRAAEELNDAIGRISDRLLDLAFDKSFDLLAEQFARIGSAASQGGGSGPGGFPGNILGLLVGGGVKAATGGLVNGPGTSTSDSIPAWLSDGEFVTRAASVTPQTLPYLEAINRGPVLPRFAEGGHVGVSAARSTSSGAMMKVEIHNHASNARVEAKPSQDGRGLKVMIWDTVSEGIMGGRFDRPNQAAFGLKRKPRGG